MRSKVIAKTKTEEKEERAMIKKQDTQAFRMLLKKDERRRRGDELKSGSVIEVFIVKFGLSLSNFL